MANWVALSPPTSWEAVLTTRSYNSLLKRLARAGFKRPFVREVILPDWWDPSCDKDPDLLPEVEMRVARFLGAPLGVVQTATDTLTTPLYPKANLRRVKTLDRRRVVPAMHVGMQVADAATRNFSEAPLVQLPRDAADWRQQILRRSQLVDLKSMVEDLWSRGIPVLHIEVLPSPQFQGMACVTNDRPVILLGHGYDAPSRLAFYVAHEMGHIVAGDCEPDAPIVEESDEPAESGIEQDADRFAGIVLSGLTSAPRLNPRSFQDLAQQAYEVEMSQQIDAGFLINAWSNAEQKFAYGQQALKALWRDRGGQRILRSATERHVLFDQASESDRQLLRCLYGEPDRDEAGRRH